MSAAATSAQLRSEFYKLRSTRTVAGVIAAMLALVTVALLLHALGLSASQLASLNTQRGVLIDVGVNLGVLFASLLGALSITAEIRSGTIRPTLLVSPRRGRVIAAKTASVLVAGFGVGVLSAGAAAAIGSTALSGRGLTVELGVGDYLQLIAGGGLAAALWAVIGLGIGAVARAQVPAIVALFAWLLFVENVALANVPSVHRFAPGALAQALAGQQRPGILHTPALAAVLLAAYAAAVIAAGTQATTHRDVP
jgi:ABC-type transport system involved in multi-copper enzyme maturation permease subunit